MECLVGHHVWMADAAASVEELVSHLREGATADALYDLWVPSELTLGGIPVPQDVAMVVVVDAVLAIGLGPAGFTDGLGGRTYHFKPWD